MRYNPPFPTSDVPVTPVSAYPRYANGDPVTGTEGSIPPAPAFDEDQIEIINVILNAGLTPRHDQLDQLWQALMALFAQKYITTPITKTVHGPGADFTDLNAAMTWLAGYIITNTGQVTFMLASGTWTYTSPVEINHANANRVVIQGGALLGGSPTPINLSLTGYHTSTDGTNHLTYLQSVHATHLSFTAGMTGFRIQRGGCTFRYILIQGSQTIGTPGTDGLPMGIGIDAYDKFFVDGISVWGFGSYGIALTGTAMISLSSLSLVVSFCASTGVIATGSLISFPDTMYFITRSHAISGLLLFSSQCYSGKLDSRGNNCNFGGPGGVSNLGGVIVEAGSQLHCAPASYIGTNNNFGITIADSSTMKFVGCTVELNSSYALWMNNGVCWVTSSSVQGGGPGAIFMNNGASCEAIGASIGGSAFPTPNVYNTQRNSFLATV